MLSAVLTFATALSTVAAPLAKKAGNQPARGKQTVAMTVETQKEAKSVVRPMVKKATPNGMVKMKSEVTKKRATAARSASAANRVIATNVSLRGSVIYANAWEAAGASAYGLYTVPRTDGESFELIGQNTASPIQAGYVEDGVYYTCKLEWFFGIIPLPGVVTYDAETMVQLNEYSVDLNFVALDLAVDPTSGDVYGCTYNEEGDGYKWSKIDYANLTVTPIADLSEVLNAVGCDANGQFYGLSANGDLYAIDKTNGELDMIAMTDYSTDYLVGGCVNTANNTFLATYSTDSEGGLVEIDLEDGTTSTLAVFEDGEEVCALYIPMPEAADKAPAAPQISVACENGAMEAVVTLVMPSTLFDGTPITSDTELGYSITVEGVEAASGTAAAGATVTETIAVETSGVTTFKAFASNAEGKSPGAKASCYVGKGTPAAPANVNLAWDNGVATLTWDAVTTAADGGYFNAADGVTYTVYDKEGKVLVKSLPNTTVAFNFPEPTDTYVSLYYSVAANYDSKTSAATKSNPVGLGAYNTPATVNINTPDIFAEHFVVDVNADGKTWVYNTSGYAAYNYSSKNAADDWLFTPAYSLEANKIYVVTAKVASISASYAERIEVYAGKAQTAEDMTSEVIPAQVVKTTTPYEIEGKLITDEAGRYNFGFHACSDANMWNLYLYGYTISAPVATTAPDVPTNVVVTPAANGDLKASIAYKAPKTDLSGNDLTGDVTVNVYRNGELVKKVTGKAGANYSINDNVPAAGTYTYTFSATNANGETGLSAKISAYVGPTTPAGVDNIQGFEANGTVTLSWDAVTTDVDGKAILPSNISYNVWTVENGYLGEMVNAEPITSTNYTFTIDTPDVQDFIQYAVQASNRGVEGGARGVMFPIGPAYEMPMTITSVSDLDDYILGYGGTAELGLGDSETFSGIPLCDGEEYFYVNGQYANLYVDFYFGKVRVAGDKPEFTFFEYNIDGTSPDMNTTAVYAVVDGQRTELKSYAVADVVPAGEWGKVKVDLSAYKGKDVQIILRSTIVQYAYSLYDCFSVSEALNYDLKAVSISAPASVETGAEFDITVNVANDGVQAAQGATVNLYRNGDVYLTKTLETLAADDAAAVVFTTSLGLHDGTSAEYSAEIVYADDQDTDNNATRSVVVTRKVSKMPVVTGLTGEATENGHELTWDAIDLGEPQAVLYTEDFESGESFAQEFEGWTFLDLDGEDTWAVDGVNVPGLGEPASWIVLDNTDDAFNASWDTASGNKCLIASSLQSGNVNNDWAISPALSGDEQTISFMGKSYTSRYGLETVQVFVTYEDSEDPDDFEPATEQIQLPDEWTKIEVELEEGVKRFAIVCQSQDNFICMIDDVTFTRVDAVEAEHLGYNVYCDGQKLNNELLTEPSYIHTTPTGRHTYHVTAVYDKGESEISAPCVIEAAGLTLNKVGQVKVSVDGKTIVVAGAEGKKVSIASVDGKVIYSAAGDARVAATSAIYLVTVDGKTVKVIVR